MKGLELSRAFYEQYGAPMLRNQFPELESLVAVGLMGSGSECFGFDDLTSRDHDFEPGFCLFLPDGDIVDRKTEFTLERAYAKLPKEFMGIPRQPLSPVGGNRHGVFRIGAFFREKVGCADGVLSVSDWLHLPEQALAEATNGAIFRDDLGILTELRDRLSYFSEDIRRKKLAGHLLLMGQSGQYNYPRCLARQDLAAAQLAAIEFVRSALHAVFLLNHTYLPYYKWQFRALRDLPRLSRLHPALEHLISSENTPENSAKKIARMEEIAYRIIHEVKQDGLTDFSGSQLEGHAYAVNGTIRAPELRTMHILSGV